LITKRAINRLKWRLTGKYSFTPNLEDKKALSEIIQYVNRSQEKAIDSNKLLTKLFIVFYNDVIKENETTVLEDLNQKKMVQLLKTPLDSFYLAFKRQLDANIRCAILENKEMKNVTDAEIKTILSDGFNLFTIENTLKTMVANAINKYSRYD